jgi:hypothetical protein
MLDGTREPRLGRVPKKIRNAKRHRAVMGNAGS